MELNSDFETFLSGIRPTKDQRNGCKTGHETLRKRLNSDAELKEILVSEFLQGSYIRSTAVRPKGDVRSDVDIIIVTKLAEPEYTPEEVLGIFVPFLDKYYPNKWRPQGRSHHIELKYVELDLVPTLAPDLAEIGILQSAAVISDDDIDAVPDWKLHTSWLALNDRLRDDARAKLAEAASQPEWQTKPLRIPNRDVNRWESTHPLAQKQWTVSKNNQCNRHFINVVKAIKWWRLENYTKPEHPKGFPLERLIGDCCPNGIESVASGVTLTLEAIVSKYSEVDKPVLPDYGVPTNDVFKRVSAKDFGEFYVQSEEAADLARRALDSTDRTESGNLWRELLGNKFPEPPNGGPPKKNGYTPPDEPAVPGSSRFA